MDNSDLDRNHKRARGIAPVVCNGVVGRLVDVSRGGLAFSVGKRFDDFKVEEICDLSIKLPRTDENPEGLTFQSSITLRHIIEDDDKKRIVIGAQFNSMAEEEKNILSRVILFFAQTYGPLQVDDFFKIQHSERKSPDLDKEEIGQVFRQVLNNFEKFPIMSKEYIRKFAKDMQRELDKE